MCLLQQGAALQEAVAQGQERERLMVDQHQQVTALNPEYTSLHRVSALHASPFHLIGYMALWHALMTTHSLTCVSNRVCCS